jgi:hypothetical protein
VGFPESDYTPFGLVANPWAECHSWEQDEGTGGVLRTTEQRPGLCWVEPWATRPRRAIGLEIGFTWRGSTYLTRGHFSKIGIRSQHHSANLVELCWSYDELDYRVRLFLADDGVLVCRWRIANRQERPVYAGPRVSQLIWRRTDEEFNPNAALRFAHHEMDRTPQLCFDGTDARGTLAAEVSVECLNGRPGVSKRWHARVRLQVPARGEVSFAALVTQRPSTESEGLHILTRAAEREAELIATDDAFWATCPQLGGDWPKEFRHGLVYDFETTRMCLQPAGGIFKDVWPAWMVNWPRAVLAEGCLDMLRLAHADPETAKRAVLSLFRDAPAPNVPCVFKHGEPNMVAADGSICGTSPAWCVPFYNLELLYLRTLDRDWLAELYPYLAAYMRWWLENRTDADGWCIYKCTWEAGEDNSPRLDPDAEGDHVISQYARPIELQAAMAGAAATLGFFEGALVGVGRSSSKTELTLGEGAVDTPSPPAQQSPPFRARNGVGGLGDSWRDIQAAFEAKVQQLWDAQEGRFRDWDTRRGGFIQPSDESDYWGTDPRRFSPLALTPLLFGQASAEQAEALRREIEHYAQPPWCDWPSWSYVVLEAASRAGWYEFAGRMAYDICRRVYAENDRRSLTELEQPMPGAAREYWPSDPRTWNASEGYGWGATTASFVIRQLCGFDEDESPSGCVFRLAPAFPPELIAGRELTLGPLPYRGRLLHLNYRAAANNLLSVDLRLDAPAACTLVDVASGALVFESPLAAEHAFELPLFSSVRVVLSA